MLKDKDFHDLVVSSIALGRVGQVEEIMGAVVYLASNAAQPGHRFGVNGRRWLDGCMRYV